MVHSRVIQNYMVKKTSKQRRISSATAMQSTLVSAARTTRRFITYTVLTLMKSDATVKPSGNITVPDVTLKVLVGFGPSPGD